MHDVSEMICVLWAINCCLSVFAICAGDRISSRPMRLLKHYKYDRLFIDGIAADAVFDKRLVIDELLKLHDDLQPGATLVQII